MQAKFVKHTLNFKRPSGTSRGILTTKDSWFLILTDQEKKIKGIRASGTTLGGKSHASGGADTLEDLADKLS